MVTLRQATFPNDADTVRTLLLEYAAHLASQSDGTERISIKGFEEELAGLPAPYRLILLVEVDHHPAGCVALKPLTLHGEKAIEMKRLWIRPEHRGLKLGKKLVLSAILHAENARFDAIYLDTVPSAMPEANRIYKNLGFQTIPRYNQNDTANLVFFRYDLKERAQLGSVSIS